MNRAVADSSTNRDEVAAEWCMRMAETALQPADQREFDVWLADADNRKAFEEAVVVWQGVENASDRPELISLRMHALETFRDLNKQRWMRRVPFFTRWRMPLALVSIVAIAAVIILVHGRQTYATGIAERRVVRLEDGSQLSLDASTSVNVSLSDARRDLRLIKGRAKFDVAKDPLRPFSVAVGNDVVVATGTSFSVEILRRQMRVVLYEGRVDVLRKSPDEATLQPLRAGASGAAAQLTPGRELSASPDQPDATVASTDISRTLSWESGQLNFINEPLESAVEQLNRYSREPLVVADARAAAVTVNGVFNAGDTRAFVEAVTAFAPVTVVEQSGRLILQSKLR